MEKHIINQRKMSELIKWLKVISEPKRIMLLERIISGVHCNCELGDELQMAPNLISHHLSVLRSAGLIDSERDPVDGRWIYYSVNLQALEQLKTVLNNFFDKNRIQPRRLTCGPQSEEKFKLDLLKLK